MSEIFSWLFMFEQDWRNDCYVGDLLQKILF